MSQPLPPALAAAISAVAFTTDPARLPVETYSLGAPLWFRLNGETIDVIAAPPTHTDGDTIVRFEKANGIVFGLILLTIPVAVWKTQFRYAGKS